MVTAAVAAYMTRIVLSEVTTVLAIFNVLHRPHKGFTEYRTLFPVAFEQLIGHSLGTFGPDSGQATERLNQIINEVCIVGHTKMEV